MSKFITTALTAAALLAVAPLSSQAADIAATPRVAPAFTWTGWYVGLNAGYAWGDADVSTCVQGAGAGTFFLAIERASICAAHSGRGLNPDGFTGGVQAGYLWQTPGQWFFGGALVLGIEADFNAFRLTDSQTVGPVVIGPGALVAHTVTHNVETDWLFTLRPRIGAAFANWLVYATGGLAITRLESNFVYSHTQFLVGAASGQAREWIAGWTIGGGVEVAVIPNWTVRAEYLHVRFDGVSGTSNNLVVSGTPAPGETFFHSADLRAHIVRGAVNYRF